MSEKCANQFGPEKASREPSALQKGPPLDDSFYSDLLLKVTLTFAVLLDCHAGGLNGREEVLHGMPTFLANPIAELESFHFSHAPYAHSILVGAALRRRRRRNNAPGIIILRSLFRRILNDVLSDPV